MNSSIFLLAFLIMLVLSWAFWSLATWALFESKDSGLARRPLQQRLTHYAGKGLEITCVEVKRFTLVVCATVACVLGFVL